MTDQIIDNLWIMWLQEYGHGKFSINHMVFGLGITCGNCGRCFRIYNGKVQILTYPTISFWNDYDGTLTCADYIVEDIIV